MGLPASSWNWSHNSPISALLILTEKRQIPGNPVYSSSWRGEHAAVGKDATDGRSLSITVNGASVDPEKKSYMRKTLVEVHGSVGR